jgi:hypothetical protein
MKCADRHTRLRLVSLLLARRAARRLWDVSFRICAEEWAAPAFLYQLFGNRDRSGTLHGVCAVRPSALNRDVNASRPGWRGVKGSSTISFSAL